MATKQPQPDFNTKILTPIFRMSYPHLFETHYNELAKRDQYDIVMLFDKKDKTLLKPMYDLMAQVAKFRFGANIKGLINPIKDGDTSVNGSGALIKEKNPTYEGMMVLNCWTKNKPGVASTQRDSKGKLILIQDSDEIYGGCYGRAEINCYAYEKGQNRGIAFGLIHVQKVKDGDPFGNRSKPEDAFASVSDNESMAEDVVASEDMFSQ